MWVEEPDKTAHCHLMQYGRFAYLEGKFLIISESSKNLQTYKLSFASMLTFGNILMYYI